MQREGSGDEPVLQPSSAPKQDENTEFGSTILLEGKDRRRLAKPQKNDSGNFNFVYTTHGMMGEGTGVATTTAKDEKINSKSKFHQLPVPAPCMSPDIRAVTVRKHLIGTTTIQNDNNENDNTSTNERGQFSSPPAAPSPSPSPPPKPPKTDRETSNRFERSTKHWIEPQQQQDSRKRVHHQDKGILPLNETGGLEQESGEDLLRSYRLIYMIGKGAFGTVNMAIHLGNEMEEYSTGASLALERTSSSCSSTSSSRRSSSTESEGTRRETWTGEDEKPKTGRHSNIRSLTHLASDHTKLIAIKILRKQKLAECRMTDQALMELRVLRIASDNPFIVDFKFAYQTPTKLYLGMEYCPRGELFTHIMKGTIHEEDKRLYIAEIGLALRHLHKLNIIYRDLKPENVALARDGHIRLLDFGLSVVLDPVTDWNPDTNRLEVVTACGTLAYSSPEILKRKRHSFESDWWSLGVISYELLCGYPPFDHDDQQITCDLICTIDFDPAENVKPGSAAYSLIRKLLEKESSERWCYYDHQFHQFKAHPFFDGLDWDQVEKLQLQPRSVPELRHNCDVSWFDEEFVSKPPRDSIPNISNQTISTSNNSNTDLQSETGTVDFAEYQSIEELCVPSFWA